MISRRTLLAASAFAATASPFLRSAKADSLTELRIGFQKAGILPAVKARGTLESAFKGRGVKVKWVEFQFGPPLLEALNTGNVDYGFTGDTPPIFAQAANANLLYVAAQPLSGNNEAVIVPKDSPIKTLRDLKGKKIGIAKGSSAHNTALSALDKAGLTLKDVTPAYLAPADATAAFAGGNIDAWSIWDPYLALAELKGARVVAFSRDVHKTNSFLLANRKFTEKHKGVVSLLNETFATESAWASDHRADIAKSLHDATGVDLAAIKNSVGRSNFNVVPISDEIAASQQKIADRFHKLGLVPKHVNVRDIVWKWTPSA